MGNGVTLCDTETVRFSQWDASFLPPGLTLSVTPSDTVPIPR